jgi:hypothetical protein
LREPIFVFPLFLIDFWVACHVNEMNAFCKKNVTSSLYIDNSHCRVIKELKRLT